MVLKGICLLICSAAFSAHAAVAEGSFGAYDADLVMGALQECSDLTYEWENPIVGEMAVTRIYRNGNGTCTLHSRDTETFHTFCILNEEQRANYAEDILRQASARRLGYRSFIENGKMVTTYTINDDEETVYRSFVTDYLNDGTCETYSTDPSSPLFEPPENRPG